VPAGDVSGTTGPSEYKHQGERVVRGQRLMQAASDPFLGWTSGLRVDGAAAKEYYVRQLRDMKGAMNVPAMDPLQLTYYAEQNQLDYQLLLNAIECRRLPAIAGL
jgi:Uncharacterized protein conserved in bacteria (DUF2252)